MKKMSYRFTPVVGICWMLLFSCKLKDTERMTGDAGAPDAARADAGKSDAGRTDAGACGKVECLEGCEVVTGEDGCPRCKCPSNPCNGLDFCDCYHREDCVYLTDSCICPCDYHCPGEPDCVCGCGGGQYLGCYPRSCAAPFCEHECDRVYSFGADGCPVCGSKPCCEYVCNMDCECRKDERGCDLPECVDFCAGAPECKAFFSDCFCDWSCHFADEPPPQCGNMCPAVLTAKPACRCAEGDCSAVACAGDRDCPAGFACRDGTCKEGRAAGLVYETLMATEACTLNHVDEGEVIRVKVSGQAGYCTARFAGCSVYYEEYIGDYAAGTIYLAPFISYDPELEARVDCLGPPQIDGECSFAPTWGGGYGVSVNNFSVLHVDAMGRLGGGEEQCAEVKIGDYLSDCREGSAAASDRLCYNERLSPENTFMLTLNFDCAGCFDIPGPCFVRVEGDRITIDASQSWYTCQCPVCGACADVCREMTSRCIAPKLPAGNYEVQVTDVTSMTIEVGGGEEELVCLEQGQ